VLQDSGRLEQASVAKRMSWASGRSTTREEDIAYCLLGIFNVNMPLLYGEGHKAFVRLQEEIMKVSTDQSLFAWTPSPDSYANPKRNQRKSVLAHHPADFAIGSRIIPYGANTSPYAMTNKGLQITLPVIEGRGNDVFSHMVVLACRSEDNFVGPIGLPVRIAEGEEPG
jgi:hypothetical protein